MTKAATYVYRNLNKGGFSAKYKGLVTQRFGSKNRAIVFANVTGFSVSSKVRDKIRQTGKKQVHAYIKIQMTLTDSWGNVSELEMFPQIKYNPKTDDNFYVTDGTPLDSVGLVAFCDDKVYALSNNTVPLNGTPAHKRLMNILDGLDEHYKGKDNDAT